MSPPNENSINIYQGNSYEAKLRRKNLLAYLTKMLELEPKTILIGEAPGIHGCGKTGIPFTDEFAIATEQFFENGDFGNMGLDHERSAAVIWNVIRNKKKCLSCGIFIRSNLYPPPNPNAPICRQTAPQLVRKLKSAEISLWNYYTFINLKISML